VEYLALGEERRMKISRIFLLALYAFALSPFASAQDPHVHTRYVKDSKTTVVETDLMYVINAPQQFMQIGLITRYAGERLEKPLKKIDLLMWSFSREALYRKDTARTLKINTDGEVWDVAPGNYMVFKGETKDGQDIFWSEKRPALGEVSTLPKEALVKGDKGEAGVNALFMEQIFIELKPDQLLKIAHAKKVDLQLGATRIGFIADQLNTIRDFSSRLAPGSQPVTDANAQATIAANAEKPGGIVDVGVVNGKALSLPRPEYPSMARGARASGSVSVFVTIDETGKVIAARAIKGHPLLREVSEAAAKQARFTPTMVSGQPVKVTGTIIYNFFQ
jgi:TonB family protein